jgi:hypothetical protein
MKPENPVYSKEPSALESVESKTRISLAAGNDLSSMFSKRKIKPSTAVNLPPPPPVPTLKTGDNLSRSVDDGWQREFQKLDHFLKTRDLKIHTVDADGSCLFSSFAIHIPGATGESVREEAVRFMLEHPHDFAPFIDTEAYPEGFVDYCARMRLRTTWGGQLEIQALSQVFKVNVYVFQTGGKSTIKMVNFDNGSKCVTLSYHEGEHYNAVVMLDSTETITAIWLEAKLSNSETPGYLDSSKPARPSQSRRKPGIFN